MKYVYNWPKYKEVRDALKETRDCTVVSMAEVFDMEYLKAHKILRERFKRKSRKGVNVDKLAELMSEYTIKKGPYTWENKISLGQFCKKHPVGRYYVIVRGHALAVIDGVVYDHSDKPRRMVVSAWRVHL